jgi:hypothetical protein
MASMRNENNGDKNKRPFEELHRIPTIENTTAYIRSLEKPLKADMFEQFTPTELTCILFTLLTNIEFHPWRKRLYSFKSP